MRMLGTLRRPVFNRILTTKTDDSKSCPDEENNMTKYHDHDDLELKKISEKKYKGVDKISTRLFNENSDEIYDQHYDHFDDENKIIDCVNDDCLAEIFMHLPACERPKLALVCKKWKRALDNAWYDVRKVEQIYWQYDRYPGFLYRNYLKTNGGYNFLKSLLNKCGRFLTKLDLTAYGECNIVPVINESCPNLLKLRLRFTDIDDEILDNAFSHLSKLKELTIIFHFLEKKFMPVTLLNSLKDIADTLTDLNFLNWMYTFNPKGWIIFLKEINCVIPQLKALKKLEVAGIYVPQAILDYVKNHRVFITDYYIYCRRKSNHQLNIMKNLDLSHCRVTDNCLYTIANAMMLLKVLYIFCEWVTDDGVVAISKMKELHTLEFIGRNNVTDSSIKLLKNLKKLKLPISNKITDVSVTKVLENSPGMEELYVEDTGVTVEFIKKAADISKNRKRLLRLFYSSVKFTPDIEQYKSQYFDIHIIRQEQKQKITEAHTNSPLIKNLRVHFL